MDLGSTMEGALWRQSIVSFQPGPGQGEGVMLFDIIEPPCQEVIRCGVSQTALAESCSPHRHRLCKELGKGSFRLEHFVVPVMGISMVVQLLLMTWFLLWFHSEIECTNHEDVPRPTLCDCYDFPYKPAFASCACLGCIYGRLWPTEYHDSGGALSCLQLCSLIPVSWDCCHTSGLVQKFENISTHMYFVFESNGSFADLTLSLVSSWGSCTIRIRKLLIVRAEA